MLSVFFTICPTCSNCDSNCHLNCFPSFYRPNNYDCGLAGVYSCRCSCRWWSENGLAQETGCTPRSPSSSGITFYLLNKFLLHICAFINFYLHFFWFLFHYVTVCLGGLVKVFKMCCVGFFSNLFYLLHLCT